jgi:hypothetical protein
MNISVTSTDFVAWLGVGLSTLLALVKLYELWRDRFRVEVTYNFAGDEEVGNVVLIQNLSDKPFILAHWELFYASRCFHRWRMEPIGRCEFDEVGQRIAPFATVKLRFSGADYFSWDANTLRNRKVYVRLHLAGRRSLVRVVYGG